MNYFVNTFSIITGTNGLSPESVFIAPILSTTS